jgi:DNA-binding NtrC family response regulator
MNHASALHYPTTSPVADNNTGFFAADVNYPAETGRFEEAAASQPAPPAPQISFHVGMTLEEVERQMLFKTMAHFNNHKPKAAQALGISLKTVYNRLARFGYASHAPTNRALEPGAAA